METSTIYNCFIQDIIDNPDDNVPRLIFADWLCDNGQSYRGDFIRHQVLGQKLPWILQRYIDKLHWVGIEHRWILEQGDSVSYSWDEKDGKVYTELRGVTYIWERGFVSEVRTTLMILEKHLPDVVKRQPVELGWADDREPKQRNLGENYYYWYLSNKPTNSLTIQNNKHFLPAFIHGNKADEPHGITQGYETSDEGKLDLAKRLVKWAKEKNDCT